VGKVAVGVLSAGRVGVGLLGREGMVVLLGKHRVVEVPVRIEGWRRRFFGREGHQEDLVVATMVCCTSRVRLGRAQAEGNVALAVGVDQMVCGRAEMRNRLVAAASRKNSERRPRARCGRECLAWPRPVLPGTDCTSLGYSKRRRRCRRSG
jgi:hypothetical protein